VAEHLKKTSIKPAILILLSNYQKALFDTFARWGIKPEDLVSINQPPLNLLWANLTDPTLRIGHFSVQFYWRVRKQTRGGVQLKVKRREDVSYAMPVLRRDSALDQDFEEDVTYWEELHGCQHSHG
jgi:hypothetical protein